MQANSRPVSSNQPGPHPRLAAIVRRHLEHTHRTLIASHDRAAFDQLHNNLVARPRPLVLDSFCGTGHSTALLAARHPEHLVVGIDRSADRLQRHAPSDSDNYLLLRADCEPIWQLLVSAGMGVDYHYLLYPNPWPKARHLQRRIHGHGSFPLLLRLGGTVELRSNWQLYVQEFAQAMQLAGHSGAITQVAADAPDISLFERKYRASGHPLWAYGATITAIATIARDGAVTKPEE